MMVLPATDASPLPSAFALPESITEYAYVYGGVPEDVELMNVTFWSTWIIVDPDADSVSACACAIPDRNSMQTAATMTRLNRFDMTHAYGYPLGMQNL